MAEAFDVVVIGGGPAGEVAADEARRAGAQRVALVEHERVGGECSYWACVPSKSLLRPAEVLWLARHAPGVREAVQGGLDARAVLAHRDAMVGGYDDASQARWLADRHVTLVRGRGRLAGVRRVHVEAAGGARELTASRAVVVAVGSVPRVPDTPGLREAHPWTNREATGAKAVPRRLLVIGGGVVAVELSQAWRALGAEEVTVLVREGRLLPRLEPFAAEALRRALEADGVRVLLGTQATRVERPGGAGEVTVTLGDGGTLRADELLVATGRTPATDDLGLETVGLLPGGALEVDDGLRVRGVEGGWLYAVGDVNGRNLLTHMGKYQARELGRVLAGKPARAWADARCVPQVLFTHPQVASVGLTEAEARKRGLEVRCPEVPLSSAAGTGLLAEGLDGRARLVIDARRDVVVGATFVGPAVGELLHAATVAVAGEVPLATLWHAVPSFPTLSEVWLRLLEADRGEPRW